MRVCTHELSSKWHGKDNDPMQDFRNALKIDDKYVDALMGRAEEFIYKKQYGNASKDLEKLLSIEPDNITAINNLGYVYERNGNINEAM